MEVEQGDNHPGQRQVGGHRQIDALGQQHHHLAEGENNQDRRIVKHLRQVARGDKRRYAAADSQHHQDDHRGQQRLAVFKQLLPHYAASCFAPLAALTMVSAVASPAAYSATIRPSCITTIRSAMPITSGSSEETMITASPWPTSSDIN